MVASFAMIAQFCAQSQQLGGSEMALKAERGRADVHILLRLCHSYGKENAEVALRKRKAMRADPCCLPELVSDRS